MPTKEEPLWESTTVQNLIRYRPSGTYFARFSAWVCRVYNYAIGPSHEAAFSLDQSGRSNVASGQRRLGYRGGSAHHRDRRAKRVWNARVWRTGGGQVR